jgi:hypothetical protein
MFAPVGQVIGIRENIVNQVPGFRMLGGEQMRERF